MKSSGESLQRAGCLTQLESEETLKRSAPLKRTQPAIHVQVSSESDPEHRQKNEKPCGRKVGPLHFLLPASEVNSDATDNQGGRKRNPGEVTDQLKKPLELSHSDFPRESANRLEGGHLVGALPGEIRLRTAKVAVGCRL
jgi:hypothetical protein